MIHDTRYAVRALRRTPGFTVAAVLMLAAGLAAAAAGGLLVPARRLSRLDPAAALQERM